MLRKHLAHQLYLHFDLNFSVLLFPGAPNQKELKKKMYYRLAKFHDFAVRLKVLTQVSREGP